MRKRVLVTGASGFIGKALCLSLKQSDYEVVAASRSDLDLKHEKFNLDLSKQFGLTSKLSSIDYIVHTAERVHVMNEKSKNPLTDFR